MNYRTFLDNLILAEKNDPTFSKHNINSYLSNLPTKESNTELKAILKYFESSKTYMTLFAGAEFNQSLSIDVQLEQINQIDIDNTIHYRKSVFHKHDFFEMIYVYSGECTTIINNHQETLSQGDLCIFNLQAVHQLTIPDENAKIFNILISQELFTETFLHLFNENDFVSSFFINSIYNIAQSTEHLVFHFQEDTECTFILHKILTEYFKKDPFHFNMIHSLLISLFLSLTRIYQLQMKEQSIHYAGQMDITDVLSYIHQHYQTITLKELAYHFGYTTRSMMRFLQSYTNHTFSEIIKEYRLKNACFYLHQTEHSIEEIAEMTGFCERSYFDKVFKKTYHITPVEYREKRY